MRKILERSVSKIPVKILFSTVNCYFYQRFAYGVLIGYFLHHEDFMVSVDDDQIDLRGMMLSLLAFWIWKRAAQHFSLSLCHRQKGFQSTQSARLSYSPSNFEYPDFGKFHFLLLTSRLLIVIVDPGRPYFLSIEVISFLEWLGVKVKTRFLAETLVRSIFPAKTSMLVLFRLVISSSGSSS